MEAVTMSDFGWRFSKLRPDNGSRAFFDSARYNLEPKANKERYSHRSAEIAESRSSKRVSLEFHIKSPLI